MTVYFASLPKLLEPGIALVIDSDTYFDFLRRVVSRPCTKSEENKPIKHPPETNQNAAIRPEMRRLTKCSVLIMTTPSP